MLNRDLVKNYWYPNEKVAALPEFVTLSLSKGDR
jgi:hypothetical protein